MDPCRSTHWIQGNPVQTRPVYLYIAIQYQSKSKHIRIVHLLRYQNSSAEFPEQNTSTYASTAEFGKVTFVTPPMSSVMVKKFGRVSSRLESGIMVSDVTAEGKSFVGA
jgi:hypothetical protein